MWMASTLYIMNEMYGKKREREKTYTKKMWIKLCMYVALVENKMWFFLSTSWNISIVYLRERFVLYFK